MRVEKIDRVHIFVKDLDKAVKVFENIFSTPFSEVRCNKELNLYWRMAPIGIELLSPGSADGIVAKFIENRGEGLAGISLKVPDIEEAITEMGSNGIRLIGKYQCGGLKEARFHPKDSFGVMIQLCQYTVPHDAFIAHG